MTRLLTARRALAATAMAPLLVTGLVACGDSSGNSSSSGATASDSATTAALSGGLSAGDQVDPAQFVKTVEDGLKNSTTAHIKMDFSVAGSSQGLSAEGDVDYTSDPPSMAVKMSLPMAGSSGMEIRTVDGIVYVSMGQLTQGKFWKIDPSDPSGPLASLGMDKMMNQMDPAKALDAMKSGITKVTYVGAENGLDHYQLTIDTKKMMQSMGATVPPSAQSQVPATVTYDLWLDSQNRFTKMSMSDFAVGNTRGSIDMTMSDWGETVHIEAPPADQITKTPNLGSMMQGMNGATA